MKRRRLDDPSDGTPPQPTESDCGITTFRSRQLTPHHPTGIFQLRWADFHVRELSEAGEPLEFTRLPTTPPPDDDEVVSFIMYKENRTTADALMQLASASGCPLSAFAVAGAKDRRACTVQRVTARGVSPPDKLLRINQKWTSNGSRVRVGHFATAERPLTLADSRGNRFVVVLREASLRSTGGGDGSSTATEEPGPASADVLRGACEEAARALTSRGFVNYFGQQRFGSSSLVPTHAVGAALLRRRLCDSLLLVLHPKAPGLKPAARAALEGFAATRDAAAALKKLPQRSGGATQRLLSGYARALDEAAAAAETAAPSTASGTASAAAMAPEEAAALFALRGLPHRQLQLYVNALQALAFNRAVTARLALGTEEGADGPIAGDLVWSDASEAAAAAAAGDAAAAAAAPDDEAVESVESAEPAQGAQPHAGGVGDGSGGSGGGHGGGSVPPPPRPRARLPPAVRVLSAAEAASGAYSLADVLLPLPGHAVTYPRNAVAAEYRRTLREFDVEAAICSGEEGEEGGEGGAAAGDSGAGGGAVDAPWYFPDFFDLPGGYRPVLAFPRELRSELVAYADDATAPLEPLDLDKIEPRAPTPATSSARAAAATAAAAAGGASGEVGGAASARWAWKLSFSLSSSVYATMLLREALHEPLEVEEHVRRAKAMRTTTTAKPK